eukprot:jgi/Hompol1/4592/HPOL_003748-RA
MPGKLAPNVVAVSEKARNLTHGLLYDRTHTAGEVLSPQRQNPLLAERDAMRESIYHRKEHQVLGRSVSKDVKLPDFTQEAEFKFGNPSKKDDAVADIMYPALEAPSPESDAKNEQVHRQYVLSHGSYKPGERRMHYGPDWQVPNNDQSGVKHRLDNDGNRVRDSMYWEEERLQELCSKLISSRLADFRERRQPEIGKVHDPIKSTIAHLPENHTFGITFPADEYSVRELLGYTHPVSPKPLQKDKTKLPPAGLPTNHMDDLSQARHIVHKIGENEDKSIVLKITEDLPGGTHQQGYESRFDTNHVFGVPTVRDPRGRLRKKKLADETNYGDELGAKALVYPTPRNVYGLEQLRKFERQINEMRSANGLAA